MSVLKQYNPATSQWEAVVLGKQGPSGTVAVTAPLTNSGTSTAAVLGVDYSALQYGQNAIINGGMEIWQRGTGFTNGGAGGSYVYTADRWASFREAGYSSTVSQVASGITGFRYAAKVGRASGDTATGQTYYFGKSLEGAQDIVPLAGKTVTFSFYAKAGANYSAANSVLNFTFITGTGADTNFISNPTSPTTLTNSFTLTSSWQRFTITFTIPSSDVTGRFYFHSTPVGTAGADDNFYVTGVQLEVGSVATPFKRAGGTIQGELAACQRYYWRTSADSSTTYMYMTPYNPAYNANTIYGAVHNPVAMRRAATSVEFSGLQSADGVNPAYAVSTIVINNYSISDKISAFQVTTSSSGMTQYRCYSLRAADNAAGYLAFSAEL